MPSVARRKLEPRVIDTPEEQSPSEPVSLPPPSAEQIYQLIREAAYFKAEARHFTPGVELQDWLEAEEEVCKRLRIS
jgi:Protein of unknown function (DUF2934)